MTANTPPPATGRDTGARLATACSLCDDCFHPSFGPNMDGEPCDYCRDCGCPSAEHTQPPAPQAGASVEALADGSDDWLRLRQAAIQWVKQVNGGEPGPDPLRAVVRDLLARITGGDR